jgi:hypothetical protein
VTSFGFTVKPSSDPTEFKTDIQIKKWGRDLDPLQKYVIGNVEVYAVEEVKNVKNFLSKNHLDVDIAPREYHCTIPMCTIYIIRLLFKRCLNDFYIRNLLTTFNFFCSSYGTLL